MEMQQKYFVFVLSIVLACTLVVNGRMILGDQIHREQVLRMKNLHNKTTEPEMTNNHTDLNLDTEKVTEESTNATSNIGKNDDPSTKHGLEPKTGVLVSGNDQNAPVAPSAPNNHTDLNLDTDKVTEESTNATSNIDKNGKKDDRSTKHELQPMTGELVSGNGQNAQVAPSTENLENGNKKSSITEQNEQKISGQDLLKRKAQKKDKIQPPVSYELVEKKAKKPSRKRRPSHVRVIPVQYSPLDYPADTTGTLTDESEDDYHHQVLYPDHIIHPSEPSAEENRDFTDFYNDNEYSEEGPSFQKLILLAAARNRKRNAGPQRQGIE